MQNLTHGIKRTVFALRESVPDGTIETGLPWHTQGCGLERAEGQKLLFVISDGLPLAEGYRGEAGIADTRREREKLEHRGIHVMAAAIGEDRELIRRIYGKGFLNISDTERIPAAMAGIIRQYMGK